MNLPAIEILFDQGGQIEHHQIMTVRDTAISAIQKLPESSDITDIIRELSFMVGVTTAADEIARGEGMDSTSAKAKLREWISA
jgi:hypothetical protein